MLGRPIVKSCEQYEATGACIRNAAGHQRRRCAAELEKVAKLNDRVLGDDNNAAKMAKPLVADGETGR